MEQLPESAREHAGVSQVAASSKPTGVGRVPGSPWKRRKVRSVSSCCIVCTTKSSQLNHPLDLLSDYGSPPRTPSRSVLSALVTPSRLRTTSPNFYHHSSPIPLELPAVRGSRSSSPISSSLLPTPSVGSDEDDPLIAAGIDDDDTTARIAPEIAVDPFTGSAKPRSLQALRLAQRPAVPASTPPTRSPSADPLSLFSPPRRPPTSRKSSNGSKASPSVSPPVAPHTPPRPSQSSIPPSPLTPVHSLTSEGGSGPRGSSPEAPTCRTHTEELTAEQLEAAAAEEAHGRYSLRTRLARQKNPYAYDEALYKRQMRSNPEAIVKVVSPRRHRKHRSRSAARSGSDGEYSGLDEAEVDPDEVLRPRRRKSRSRSVVGEAEAEADDEGRSSRPRSRHKRTPSKQGGGSPARHTSRKENAKDPPRRITWQPSAFDETFSDSDEGVLDDVANVPEEKKQETARRKRARPFPMRKKDALRRSSTPEQAIAGVSY